MAYNSKAAKDNDEGVRRQDLERAYTENQAARGAPIGAPPPQQQAPAASVSSSEPSLKPAAHEVPAAEEGRSRGYATRVPALHTPSRPGLTLRLERYIDEVAAFRGFSSERVEQIKDKAALSPAAALAAYQQVYLDEVAPKKKETVDSLKEAMNRHPDKTVFALRRGKDAFYETVERGSGSDLLHGTLVESVSPLSTPFRLPAEVFAQRQAPTLAAPALDDPEAAMPEAPTVLTATAEEEATVTVELQDEDNPFASGLPPAIPNLSTPTPAVEPEGAPAAPRPVTRFRRP